MAQSVIVSGDFEIEGSLDEATGSDVPLTEEEQLAMRVISNLRQGNHMAARAAASELLTNIKLIIERR